MKNQKTGNLEAGKPKMVFKPLSAFRNKLFLYIFTVWLATTLVVSVVGSLIFYGTELSEAQRMMDFFRVSSRAELFQTVFIYYLVIVGFIVAFLTWIAVIYTRTMEFQIWGHEVVVKKGVINKTEKHVPYRTVTNISTRFGIYDRIFDIGTVEIQTAGKSGASSGPEEKIEGIRNFVEIRNVVLEEIRRFRAQYATTTEVEALQPLDEPVTPVEDVAGSILKELREIRGLLAKR